MPKHLLTVEDAFNISGWGLLVVPGLLVSVYDGPRSLRVTLRRPGGAEKSAILTLRHHFLNPPPKEHRWGCCLTEAEISDVPAGTQIWMDEE